MSFLLSMALPFLGCFVLVATTSVLWWSTLQRPWLFAAVGLLAMLGVHRIAQIVLEFFKLFPVGRGYFLVARDEPNFVQLAQEHLAVESLLVTAFVVAVGIPLLLWFKGSLPSA